MSQPGAVYSPEVKVEGTEPGQFSLHDVLKDCVIVVYFINVNNMGFGKD